MIKRLITNGNSVALIIDRPILTLLDMMPKSNVDLRTDGRSLIVTPCDDLEVRMIQALNDPAKRDRVRKALMD